jgi:hypothetical protein
MEFGKVGDKGRSQQPIGPEGARTIQPVRSCKAIGKYAQSSLGLGFGGLLQNAGLVLGSDRSSRFLA